MPNASQAVTVRRLTSLEKAVEVLVRPALALYPDSDEWYRRVKAKVAVGAADAFAVYSGEALAGVALGVLKSESAYKLRTFTVASEFRGRGLGALLLKAIEGRALSSGAEVIYVTTDARAKESFGSFVIDRGYSEVASVEDRYGVGRNELVYSKQL